jgi:hypothetical protein
MLHTEELNLYYLPDIIRMIRGHAACIGEMITAYRVLVRKPEWKRPLGRLRHRWEDNIKMDFKEIRWGIGIVFF